MSPFFIFTLFLTAVSFIHKDDELSSCGPTIFETNCHQPLLLPNIMFSNLVKAKLLLLHVCFNQKVLPLPPSRPSFKLAILLLLAGDVSLNPGPFGLNERSKIATMNVRSIKPNTAPFSEYVTSTNLDIVVVTETWLKHDDTQSMIAYISPPGYSFFYEPRTDQRAGGGVGILVSDQLKTAVILCHHLNRSKRSLHVSETIGSVVLLSACIGFKRYMSFFYEFQDLLENIISLHDNLYILGDFKLHLDNLNGNTNKFNEILTCFDLKQHVNFNSCSWSLARFANHQTHF